MQTTRPTPSRGNTRLEYIIFSSNTPTPFAMGHIPYNLLNIFDHRVMYINLNVDITISTMVPAELQEIHSDLAKVMEFITTIHQHLTSNNMYEQFDSFINTLTTENKPWIQANIINDQIGIAIQYGKKKCWKYRKPPWSKKILHASLTVRYWYIARKEKLYKTTNIDARNDICNTLPRLSQQLTQMKIIEHQIRLSRKTLQEIRLNAVQERK